MLISRIEETANISIGSVIFMDMYTDSPGGAISVNGSLHIYSSTFINVHGIKEGGAIYNCGHGVFEAAQLCFSNCSTTYVTNDFGGNIISLIGKPATMSQITAVSSADKRVAAPGDSIWILKSTVVDINDVNLSNCYGYQGSVIGHLADAEGKLARVNAKKCNDRMIAQATTIDRVHYEKVCIVDCTLVYRYFIFRGSVTLSDCVFVGITGGSAETSEVEPATFINCISDVLMLTQIGVDSNASSVQFSVVPCIDSTRSISLLSKLILNHARLFVSVFVHSETF